VFTASEAQYDVALMMGRQEKLIGKNISMAIQPCVGSWWLFQFLELLHGRTPWTGDQPVAGPLPAHRIAHTNRINTRRQSCL
jgi:hypothetical protein